MKSSRMRGVVVVAVAVATVMLFLGAPTIAGSDPPIGVFNTDKHFDLWPHCSGKWCFQIDYDVDYLYLPYVVYELKYNNVVKATIWFPKSVGQSLGIGRIWLNGPNGKLYLFLDHAQNNGRYHDIYRYELNSTGGTPVLKTLPRRISSPYSTIAFLYSRDGSMFYLHTPTGINRTIDHTVYWTHTLAKVCSYPGEIYEMVQRRVEIKPGRIVQIKTWDNTIYAQCSY